MHSYIVVKKAIRQQGGRWALFDHEVGKYVAFGSRKAMKAQEYGYYQR